MKKIMRLIILFSLIFISVNVNAQTFKCTDIEFSEYAASFEKKVQRTKKNSLGAILQLEIFENDIKAIRNEVDSKKTYTGIFTKVSNNQYEYKDKNVRIILKLKTILGYINECEIINYNQEKYLFTVKYKREMF